ncbi:MAG: dienelactone hydrolase family protein [Myxococcota bacterium]
MGKTIERETAFGRFHAPETGALASTFPGLVLIHDVWGPSEHSRDLGRRLAEAGFAVLAIDLYRRLQDPRVGDPGERIRSLDDRAVLADLDAAADALASEALCRGRRLGVIGVCMGGTYALLAACHSDRFSASAPFYGLLSYDHGMHAGPEGRDRVRKPSSPIESAPRLRMPLLASFGCEDAFVPESDVDRLEAELAKSGVAHRIDRYAGAGHAFLNATRPDAHRPEAAALALGRAVDFLHEHLHEHPHEHPPADR